ncbi:biotin--[acetyl-CoA-carboxylase] ligase [Rubinisphaera margarita]|uniref:biotin--[acetyl-CoA-carboxylase] ligase n=1 Tax=Rubinisphaera margarita TaxID=2909586 RepID=UPI001EE7E895|nr:biotin--[acetyl-CoA-carboxylase] ligase [Rubinisphaera margarita]MCG6157972.1 biotin--[acetyl-CoA-carboxylase] ligase [Rubinisphaera margarita]
MSELDPLDAGRLQQACPDWTIDLHAELDSTNRHAREEASRYQTPAVIIAESQTAGRGRGRNLWRSHTGSLTFSILIEPQQYGITATETPLLSLVTAAVVRETVSSLQLTSASDYQLKWPNDLYLRNRKLSGILLEQTGSQPPRLVIGIGLNVNNSTRGMPPELRESAISLTDLAGCPLDRTAILSQLLLTMQRALEQEDFRQQMFPGMWQRDHLLDDQLVTIETGSGSEEEFLMGRCEGIDETGALILRDHLTTHRIVSGVVKQWTN